MKINVDNNVNNQEIDSLEEYLLDFQEEWKVTQSIRSSRWRKHFVIYFILAILVSTFVPQFLWVGLVVIAYFAGSLFSLLRQNAKTTHQIVEHKKQLKLVRLLRNFESSPYSQK